MGIHEDEETHSSEQTILPLTAAEDSELRQLTWFARAGQLGEASSRRWEELRARDRRCQVRDDRPDPFSHAADLVGQRLAHRAGSTLRCTNCGTPVGLDMHSAVNCAACGFRLPVD